MVNLIRGFDRDRIPSDTIAQVPFPGDSDSDQDFNRYTPHEAVRLELHAQDRIRSATGWAAVAENISDNRLKARVVDPVQPSDLWGKDAVIADIVAVAKLTSEGYVPFEIQITAIRPTGEDPSPQQPTETG